MKITATLLLLAVLLPAPSLSAQNLGSLFEIGGTLYYLTMPDTVDNIRDSRFSPGDLGDPQDAVLLIYSPVDQQVRIGRAGGSGQSNNLRAGVILEFDLSTISTPANTTINIPSSEVIKVEADFPILLYAYRSNHFGTAAFTPLPVEAWGREYVAASWPGGFVRNIYPADETSYNAREKRPAPALITIVAAYDRTEVSISPTDSLQGCLGCTRVTLDEGESYMVQSFVDTTLDEDDQSQIDIAGTRIVASKPIGVMSGNTRTTIRGFNYPALAGNSPKDQVIAWLRPIELHGTEFLRTVFRDERRARGLKPEEDRGFELVRIYPTTSESTASSYSRANDSVLLSAERGDTIGGFYQHDIVLRPNDEGHRYLTSAPAQAFLSPQSHILFNTTTGFGDFIGAAFDSWGTSMVELIPRSHWSSFAPIRLPSIPASTRHYLNVVTDTASRGKITYRRGDGSAIPFPLEFEVPGTGYIWGTVSVSAGTTYLVEGADGAEFSGYVYGENGGYELYRPGGTERDDGKERSSSAHPAEYEELIAEAYAFPLPSRLYPQVSPNNYRVDIVEDSCGARLVTIDVLGEPNGVRYFGFDRDSTRNMRLEWVEPSAPPSPIDRLSRYVVRIVPIDRQRSGEMSVIWQDRSLEGGKRSVSITSEPIVISSVDAIELEERAFRGRSDTSVVYANRSDRPVTFRYASIDRPGPGLSIVGTVPANSWSDSTQTTTILPGDSIEILLRIPSMPDERSPTSVTAHFDCGITVSTSIEVVPDLRCLRVSDLDFGLLEPGQRRSLELEVCNTGSQQVNFTDSSSYGGGAFLSWLDERFEVDPAAMTRLRSVILGTGSCVTITVTFNADTADTVSTTARFWANTRKCRDTSIWRVVVRDTNTVSVERELPVPGRLDLTMTPFGIPDHPRNLPLLPDTDRRKRPEGHFVYLAPWLWTSSSTYRSSSPRSLRSGRERN